MIRRLLFACLLALLLSGGAVSSSVLGSPSPQALPADSTALGVVWTPPDAAGPALYELDRIHATGATAVRLTALPPADTVFTRADSLGLTLFVDLPVSYVSAGGLSDSLQQASPSLRRVRALAQRHRSVQYVGLARSADTTVPTACSTLAAWTDRLHAAPAPLRTYYVTPFSAAADRCGAAVDRPLIDVRARPSPVQRWHRWRAAVPQAGMGALGTWTHPNAASGLRVPHSPEQQARYLERSLSRVLDSTETPPSVLFVYRWKDDAAASLPNHHFGLHDTTGAQRPAADVVAGIYTGRQHVFAFPSGTAPPSTPHGLLLLGWGLVALLGGAYAQSPFVRETAARYFVAHGFYRDAVKKGRDVNPLMNGVLLMIVATAVGLAATALARIAARHPVTPHVVGSLPAHLGALVIPGLSQPTLAGVVAGGLVLVLLIGWAAGLLLAARSDAPLSPSQGLMLVVWPCWSVLPGLVIALIAVARPPVSPLLLGTLLLGGGLVTSGLVTARVLSDYRAVSAVSPLRLVPLALVSPPGLLLLGTALLPFRYDVPVPLLWSLLTQT